MQSLGHLRPTPSHVTFSHHQWHRGWGSGVPGEGQSYCESGNPVLESVNRHSAAAPAQQPAAISTSRSHFTARRNCCCAPAVGLYLFTGSEGKARL